MKSGTRPTALATLSIYAPASLTRLSSFTRSLT
jgi:hypothetical protein